MKTIVILIAVLTFTGCAVQESVLTKDGKEYGAADGLFRGRWWSFYERGISYAEGGFYNEAAEDFRTALAERKDDQWRSRTYGMHFVNYFPHRELGITYYRTENYSDAERELEKSLETAESAKAKYYLNRTRRSLLKLSGSDKRPPSIMISQPSNGTTTNKASLHLKGEAVDDHYVSSLFVNDIPYPIELSAQKVTFERKVALKKGFNTIRVRTGDLAGKTSEKILRIHSDRDGPLIIIEEQQTRGRKVLLTGVLTDSTRISSFMINGRSFPLNAGTGMTDSNTSEYEFEFRAEVELPEGTDTVFFEAADGVSNVTAGKLQAGRTASKLRQLPLLASASPKGVLISNTYAGNEKSPYGQADTAPPKIHLKDLPENLTVYTDSLFIEGRISDDSQITTLMVNGESVLRRKGKKVFFNYLTTLREGENILSVVTADIFGNRSEKTVTVLRKIPKARQIGSRMSISILPLISKGEESLAGQAAFDMLISSFIKLERFRLIERERMEEVLRELRLSQTELTEPDKASEIGKIVVADVILTGTVYESSNAIEIFTRLVDTETSDIIDALDVYDEDKSFEGMKRLMAGLALKYRQSLPLMEGQVIKKDGRAVLTNLGKSKNIKRNMRLILFREGDAIKDPLTARVLGSEPAELGEAKIEKLYDEFSRAVMKKGSPAAIRVEDRVITK